MKRILTLICVFGVLYIGFALFHYAQALRVKPDVRVQVEKDTMTVAEAESVPEHASETADASVKRSHAFSNRTRLQKLVFDPSQFHPAVLLDEAQHLTASLFMDSSAYIGKVAPCLLQANRCNQKVEGEYFDPDRTPVHRNLNRSLMVVQEVIARDARFYDELNRNQIVSLTKINNNATPVLALQILSQGHIRNEEYRDLIQNAQYLRGTVRSSYLSLLNVPENLKKEYIRQILASIMDKNDRDTALEVQKRLGSYRLSKDEFLAAAKKSCYLRDDGSGEDLWPILKKNLAIQSEIAGYHINPNEICKI